MLTHVEYRVLLEYCMVDYLTYSEAISLAVNTHMVLNKVMLIVKSMAYINPSSFNTHEFEFALSELLVAGKVIQCHYIIKGQSYALYFPEGTSFAKIESSKPNDNDVNGNSI